MEFRAAIPAEREVRGALLRSVLEPLVGLPIWVVLNDAAILGLFAIGSFGFEPRLEVWPGYSLNEFLVPIAGLGAWTVVARGPRVSPRMVLSGSICVGVLAAAYLWTPAYEYGWQKLTHVAGFWLLAWVWSERTLGEEHRIRRALISIMGVGAALGAIGIALTLLHGWSGRLAVLGGGPNVFSRWVGMGLLIFIGLLPGLDRRWRWAVAPFVAIGVFSMAVALLLANSKGSLLAFLAGLMVLQGALLRRWSSWRRGLVCVVALALVGSVTYAVQPAIFARLILSPTDPQSVGSYGARLSFLRTGLEMVEADPLVGVGLGGFAMEALRVDEKRYPHNLIAEVLSEAGVLLGSIFLLLLSWALYDIWHRMDRSAQLTPVLRALLAFTGVAVLFSGDLVDSRILILALAMAEANISSRPGFSRRLVAPKGLH